MTTELRHDQEGQGRGTWWLSKSGYVFIRCPVCNISAILRDAPGAPPRADGTSGHAIGIDGMVQPSVVCPHAPCDWHVYARLADWPVPV